MNRKFMFGSAALMLALGFTACSSQEDALQTADEVLTSDTNFFFNIEVSNPTNDGSRADGDYDAGTSDEQKINSILFHVLQFAGCVSRCDYNQIRRSI